MIRFWVGDQHEDERLYEVRVYPNRKTYFQACKRYDEGGNHRGSMAATFHRYTVVFEGGRWRRVDQIEGRVYLHEECLDAEIVSHEALHVALAFYRLRHRGTVSLGRNQTDQESAREEELAYSIGRVTLAIAQGLHDHEIWHS